MAVTLCPLALTAGCPRCPIFRICPLKGIIGDQHAASDAAPEQTSAAPRKRRPRASPKSKP